MIVVRLRERELCSRLHETENHPMTRIRDKDGEVHEGSEIAKSGDEMSPGEAIIAY